MATIEMRTVVEKVTRQQNSKDGNPRKRLWTTGGIFDTKRDAMCAYAVSDEWHNKPIILTLEHGEVIYVEEDL